MSEDEPEDHPSSPRLASGGVLPEQATQQSFGEVVSSLNAFASAALQGMRDQRQQFSEQLAAQQDRMDRMEISSRPTPFALKQQLKPF